MEEMSVEVLALPSAVDEELLCLYFENRRRSGGGPLVSVDKKEDCTLLVFEDAEAAARVLSNSNHVLHNVELIVRRPAAADPCRLLLRGINPNTQEEMIELYVENMTGWNVTDYTLHRSPGGDLVLIHLSQPFSEAVENLNAKISRRTLDGAKVTLEQIQQTDSILVENVQPGTSGDMLTLYFESKRGGQHRVKEVTMLSEGTARVSFVQYESVEPVLDQLHRLEGTDLAVKPYFGFLLPAESAPLQPSQTGRKHVTEDGSEEPRNMEMQANPPTEDDGDSDASHMTLDPPAAPLTVETVETVDHVMEDQTVDTVLSEHIVITDPEQLHLFRNSNLKRDIEKARPKITVQLGDDGVHVSGPGKYGFEEIKRTVSDFFTNMVQTPLTLQPEEAQFCSNSDVKELLLDAMKKVGLLCRYDVSDRTVVVTAASQDAAQQACQFLRSQLCCFSVPVDEEQQCLLFSREWSDFVRTLALTSVTVSAQGAGIDVLTLKMVETEKQTAIRTFLSKPDEKEVVISMELGALKYIQTHNHQLLADMAEVSIFPLEGDDLCGLKVHGPVIACEMAEEVLQGMVSSICTKNITVEAPGVTRFLTQEDCKSILKEMERKFQVYIIIKHVPWRPLQNPDIFEAAMKMMSQRNFQKLSAGNSAQDRTGLKQADRDGVPNAGLLEDAKRIVSAIQVQSEDGASNADLVEDMDDVDLYRDEPTDDVSVQDDESVGSSQAPAEGHASGGSGFAQLSNGAQSLPSDLEEEAQLSLAIQFSLESSQWSAEDEEEQLRKALELSKNMIEEVSPGAAEESQRPAEPRARDGSARLETDIAAANTLDLAVFAMYSSDLFRVNIAFNKRVKHKQVEEKLEVRHIKKMTEYHRKCVEVIKRKHAVEIKLHANVMAVSGFLEFVHIAMPDVKLLLEKISNSIPDQEILRTIQWVRHDPASSDPTPYSSDATVFIENTWRTKREKVDILLDNKPHTINFQKMEEHNITSGQSVKISRKLLDLGDLTEVVPDDECSLLSNLPHASRVNEDSDEFQNVVKSFYETIQEYHSKIKIVQMEKLTNPLLHSQYKLKKASIVQQAMHPEVERTLYHGTSETSVREICIHGFNRSFCGKNATVYGQGVYFAIQSALSLRDQYSPPNDAGHKFIFVSKVLTGDFTEGRHSMRTAPLKEDCDIPLRYDSVTDSVGMPSMFVIFNDTQAYPEYLITCKKISR